MLYILKCYVLEKLRGCEEFMQRELVLQVIVETGSGVPHTGSVPLQHILTAWDLGGPVTNDSGQSLVISVAPVLAFENMVPWTLNKERGLFREKK